MFTDVAKEVREAYQDNLQTMHAVGLEQGRRDLVRSAVADYGALSPCAWAADRPVLDGLPVHPIPHAIAVTARLLAHPAAQRSAVAWDIRNEARAHPAPPDPDPVSDADTDG